MVRDDTYIVGRSKNIFEKSLGKLWHDIVSGGSYSFYSVQHRIVELFDRGGLLQKFHFKARKVIIARLEYSLSKQLSEKFNTNESFHTLRYHSMAVRNLTKVWKTKMGP